MASSSLAFSFWIDTDKTLGLTCDKQLIELLEDKEDNGDEFKYEDDDDDDDDDVDEDDDGFNFDFLIFDLVEEDEEEAGNDVNDADDIWWFKSCFLLFDLLVEVLEADKICVDIVDLEFLIKLLLFIKPVQKIKKLNFHHFIIVNKTSNCQIFYLKKKK